MFLKAIGETHSKKLIFRSIELIEAETINIKKNELIYMRLIL
jgi:hypothetical protein